MPNACQRAEILAGAIALGEARNGERDEYRRHLASCSSCLWAFGGEREIERVMETVREAREHETWRPVQLSLQRPRRRRFSWFLGFALSLGGVTLAIFAFHHAPAHTPAVRVAVAHAAEHRPVARPPQIARVEPPAPQMIVVHNVVTLKSPVTTSAGITRPPVADVMKSMTVVAHARPKPQTAPSNIPVWRRERFAGPRAIVPPAVAAAPPRLTGRAEAISMSPVNFVRDVVPLGGDTAINPEPPMIAYREGAEGTTAFEVSVDERGMPMKCTITKSSGYLVLDETVCKAAMKARFSPREVNGRAVQGVYRDAFTFRNPNTNDGL